MLKKIQNKIESELRNYLRELNKRHSLSKLSPVSFRYMSDFVLRKGKRLRPTLFIIAYLGYAKKEVPNLYKGALSLELIHDFMLVHDDIIDKADLRRGKPSMHNMLNKYIQKYRNIKSAGEELAIVAGDILYATGIYAFLSIKEKSELKEMALKQLIQTAIYTANGEFIEILCGMEDIERVKKEYIYKIYDYKTAYYTFSCPLSMGAILAGAGKKQVNSLFQCGLYLGRAFQIKDDISSLFSKEEEIDKSILTDLEQARKTILIWHAYHNSTGKNKLAIKRIFSKKNVGKKDLFQMRKIISESDSLNYAKGEISKLLNKANSFGSDFKMRPDYKNLLFSYSRQLLNF